MARALVTGVTGQDGSYLAEALLAAGTEVHGIVVTDDARLPDLRALAPAVVTHVADLGDPASVEQVVREVEPDVVYNLGGISSVAFSWDQPVLTGRVSGLGVGALLEVAHRVQEESGRQVRVLQASSSEIFGSPVTSPQDETTPVAPLNPYGAAKAYAHHLVAVYRARGLHASTVILFNHESPRRPPTFVTRKITAAAAAIAGGRQERLSLGNLDARRDWGWAPDYVEAMRRAVSHDEAGDYVVATGVAHSVRDFVEAAFTHAGIDDWADRVDVDQAFVRPTDATLQIGDARRAREVLGWSPTTTFAQMVAAMVDHDLALDGR